MTIAWARTVLYLRAHARLANARVLPERQGEHAVHELVILKLKHVDYIRLNYAGYNNLSL